MVSVCEALEGRRLLSLNVLSYHYDTANTGVDAVETALTPAVVGSASFGSLPSIPVDGRVYAQPLYVSNLAIPNNGTHNVLFVATEADSVYAFDAVTGAQLWKTSLLGANETPGLVADGVDTSIGGLYSGITGTPVIDTAFGTIYAVAKTETVVGGVKTFIARIHALDITNGAEKFGGPTQISATVQGTSEGTTTNSFSPFSQLQRAGLALVNGVVYVGWCTGNGSPSWHGWVMGYGAQSLQPVAVFDDTPNGPAEAPPGRSGAAGGGIWMSGAAPVVDSSGNLYYAIGDGNFDPTLDANGFPANGDYGDCFVKLTPDSSTSANPNINGWGLKVTDYFAPSNQALFNNKDLDLGSGGLLMLTNQPGTTANELIGSDKTGNIYVINRDLMGKYDPTGDHAVQELSGVLNDPNATVVEEDGSYETPVVFNNVVYFHGANDVMKTFTLSNGKLSTTPAASSNTIYEFPGATPVVSANGTSNALVWETQYSSTGNGTLNSYDPTSVSTPIFSGTLADHANKFTAPVVADGRVYVGGASSVAVFGLLAPASSGTFIDSGGPAASSYLADTDFSGGSTFTTSSSINTSADTTGAPASVYQSERYGNFTYTVPGLVAGNTYTVRLHFAEIYWTTTGQRLFNVSINGQQVLTSFDIVAAAGGPLKAVVKPFSAVADANGKITMVFTSVKDQAKVSAIDVISTANSPPVVTTNPTSQTVTAGQNASFTAAASGSPAPTVQWQFSTDNGVSFANVTGNASATTTTLTLPSVSTTLSGTQYRAVFTNSTSVNTTSATLTVNPAPSGTFIDSGGPAAAGYLADTDFSGGSTFTTSSSINTSADTTGAPASVYQSERYGNFTYTVPGLVANNTYTVRLHFAEIYWTTTGQRLFNVSINGKQVLTSFDIVAAAGGPLKAVVEPFSAVADANGKITMVFTSVKDQAKVSAIDVISTANSPPVVTTNPTSQIVTAGQNASFTAAASGSPAPTVQWQFSTDNGNSFSNVTANASATTTTLTLPSVSTTLSGTQYRAVFTNSTSVNTTSATLTVNPAPSGTFIDAGGPAASSYLADTDFSGGFTFTTSSSINTSADTTGAPASVYQSERYGNFTYTVPGLVANSTYTVRLHFAEIYWTTTGQRLFNVSINGQQVLTSFDIVAAAGGPLKAVVKPFSAVADANGKITMVFTSVKDQAKVSAIDVV